MSASPDVGNGTGTLPDATDEVLLERAARGDQDAIAVLYDRYRGLMYGLASRITGDQSLAQDVVQDAFVGIWRNASRFSSGRASGRTWILSITHHRAVDAVRRRRPTSELPDPELPPPAQLVTPDVWPEVAGRLDADTVRAALASLSPVQREAIELAYFGGLTQEEIALRTKAPLGTVKSRVRLGLLQLRATLDADRPRDDQGDDETDARFGDRRYEPRAWA
jgi:RNA polymerase sigma-70 factor (ECF subfamily)